jgi:hypothetical protein
MRILVTGSRWATTDHTLDIHLALADATRGADGPITLVHGKCPRGGVDLLAHHAAVEWDWTVEPHPADWDRYGKRAGMIRNADMVDLGADICLAFPGTSSVGTWDCIRKAANAGIHVRIYPLKDCR